MVTKLKLKGQNSCMRAFVPFVTSGKDKTSAFSASKKWLKYGIFTPSK
jgi:hypothetical protein